MMGLERSEGVLVDDVKLALRGHMRDGYQVQLLQMIFCVFISILKLEVVGVKMCYNPVSYILTYTFNNCPLISCNFVFQFNPASKLSEDDPFYNKNPSTNDTVHVLVLVIDANTVSVMSGEVVQKIQEIRREASDLGENRNLFPVLFNRRCCL